VDIVIIHTNRLAFTAGIGSRFTDSSRLAARAGHDLRPAGLYHASETGTNFNVISNTDSPDFALASILYADFREIIPRNLQTLRLTYGYRGESLPPWE
jgi:secreted trypsin-like serine protease